MKQVFAATHNQHKLIELLRILGPRGIEVFPPPDPERIAQVVEDGESFADNALIKARALFADTGMPSLADDSGLCVDALGGRPGVYSARYLGEETPYDQKMAGLLRELEGVPDEQRTARFECAIALVTASGEHVFRGSCEGRIGQEPRGTNGFGYDPLFYVGAVSYAELPDSQKDAISHRARALGQLCGAIDRLL